MKQKNIQPHTKQEQGAKSAKVDKVSSRYDVRVYFYTNLLVWTLVLLLIGNYAFGWTIPTSDPPGGDLSAPLDTSSTAQTKAGDLTIDGLLKVGRYSSAPSGSNGVLYYNTATNKFQGYQDGSWSDLGGGGSLWTLTGSDIYYTSGNVGIGTTAPGAKLDVAGRIWQTGTGSSVFLGEGAGASDDLSNNYNVFIGNNAGYSNTTGSSNTALGNSALYSNTTGYNNTALGRSALNSNTTGSFNTALGPYTLYYNTTGYSNTALGTSALYSNTTGYSNTALGDYALYSNTEGYFNSALGYFAGRYISGGSTSNVTSTNSLYLGSDTRALASGDTNEIVIGYQATGVGSNSVVLGNDSITKTILKGNVGIGTTTPSEKLEVSGNIKLSGASPTYKITNVATPTASSDVATKGYVDAQGFPYSVCKVVCQAVNENVDCGAGWTRVWEPLQGNGCQTNNYVHSQAGAYTNSRVSYGGYCRKDANNEYNKYTQYETMNFWSSDINASIHCKTNGLSFFRRWNNSSASLCPPTVNYPSACATCCQ